MNRFNSGGELVEFVLNTVLQMQQMPPSFIVAGALMPVLGLVVGAANDPQGWANSVLYGAVDVLAFAWPSTPDSLKVGSILQNLSGSLPFGYRIISEFFQSVGLIFTFWAGIKLYKLLPFKFS